MLHLPLSPSTDLNVYQNTTFNVIKGQITNNVMQSPSALLPD